MKPPQINPLPREPFQNICSVYLLLKICSVEKFVSIYDSGLVTDLFYSILSLSETESWRLAVTASADNNGLDNTIYLRPVGCEELESRYGFPSANGANGIIVVGLSGRKRTAFHARKLRALEIIATWSSREHFQLFFSLPMDTW